MLLPTLAYIGPGAGIALLGSFLAVAAATLSGIIALITWPLRRLARAIRGRRALKNAKTNRVIVVGLDGLEPSLLEQFISEGILPNLASLNYQHLATTTPPLSPVAWSSFATGANPGKHAIFDFILPDPHDHLPRISSVRITPPRRQLKLGHWTLPLSPPRIEQLRKSKPFWSVLSEHNVFSAILRVPITFPPDKFKGLQLAAMCVPDLLGSQGSFFHFTEAPPHTPLDDEAGRRFTITRDNHIIRGTIPGPPNPLRVDHAPITLPFTLKNKTLHISGQRIPLEEGKLAPWINLTFTAAPGIKIHGICRVLLNRLAPPFDLYITALHIDPAKPVMPISHPRAYATYLAKRLGPFATLGLAEDTSALSENIITEDQFLNFAYDIHAERDNMLHDAIDRIPRGVIACVYDAPDRIQHMFFRDSDKHRDTIRNLYINMDQTVARVLKKKLPGDVVIVMSDHGFKPFRRAVDLNAFLRDRGYLVLKDGATESDAPWLADVDWIKTRAYALGLAGIFVCDKSESLINEIADKLTGLIDPATNDVAIHEAIPASRAYSGPYKNNAPDIIVGYTVGHRVAWNAAVGKTGPDLFTDNNRAWSGDHCVHPDLVPGVLLTNIPLGKNPASIMDIAPTILDLMGINATLYMDGRSLLCDDVPSTN